MTRTKNIDVVFVGNFAQDTIITNDGCTNHAMGGSVTYGPLAAASFCSSSSRDDEIGCTVRIISWIGDDITPENRKFIQERFENAPNIMIHRLQSSTDDSQEPNTTAAYKLEYDENNCRTLSLPQKGRPIGVDHVKRHIGSPDAVFFVPIAAEFDEDLIIQTIQHIRSQPSNNSSSSSNNNNNNNSNKGRRDITLPIVATDVQGFIREFDGSTVITRDPETMKQKLRKMAPYITFLKAEYSEASAIINTNNQHQHIKSPRECAIELQRSFGIPFVAVTLGPAGCFVAYQSDDNDINSRCVYIPTFVPRQIADETGCGDCFLACTIMEFLIQLRQHGLLAHDDNNNNNKGDSGHTQTATTTMSQLLIRAVEVGSAATSYRVESKGPHGFRSRADALKRVESGKRMEPASPEHMLYSVTKYPGTSLAASASAAITATSSGSITHH